MDEAFTSGFCGCRIRTRIDNPHGDHRAIREGTVLGKDDPSIDDFGGKFHTLIMVKPHAPTRQNEAAPRKTRKGPPMENC